MKTVHCVLEGEGNASERGPAAKGSARKLTSLVRVGCMAPRVLPR
jgi:hypothetical protein